MSNADLMIGFIGNFIAYLVGLWIGKNSAKNKIKKLQAKIKEQFDELMNYAERESRRYQNDLNPKKVDLSFLYRCELCKYWYKIPRPHCGECHLQKMLKDENGNINFLITSDDYMCKSFEGKQS